jgi:hypothetical protein
MVFLDFLQQVGTVDRTFLNLRWGIDLFALIADNLVQVDLLEDGPIDLVEEYGDDWIVVEVDRFDELIDMRDTTFLEDGFEHIKVIEHFCSGRFQFIFSDANSLEL